MTYQVYYILNNQMEIKKVHSADEIKKIINAGIPIAFIKDEYGKKMYIKNSR